MEIWELVARESVRQTIADYTVGTDRFRLDALAACFAPDGALHIAGVDAMVGPSAIVAGLRAQVVGPPPGAPIQITHVRHHVSSIIFGAVNRERVAVSSYFVVFTDIGVDHWGRYSDVLVPVGQRWLFESRSITVEGFSDHSLMRPVSA